MTSDKNLILQQMIDDLWPRPSLHAWKVLYRAEIDTVGKLVEQSERDLQAIGLEKREIDDLREGLDTLNRMYDIDLALKSSDPDPDAPDPDASNLSS